MCLKTPDLANLIKQQISTNPNINIGGSRLFVANYEPKEVREIQQKAIREKADYANATSGGQSGMNPNDLLQKPEAIQTLMMLMQHLQSQGRPMGPR